MIVSNLKPPYYAVIFTTLLTDDIKDYEETAVKLEELVKNQEGFLGIEHSMSKVGITIPYWKDKNSILKWQNNTVRAKARERGREQWYHKYQLRICKVEKEYGFINK